MREKKRKCKREKDGSMILKEKYWRRNKNTEEGNRGVTGGAGKS